MPSVNPCEGGSEPECSGRSAGRCRHRSAGRGSRACLQCWWGGAVEFAPLARTTRELTDAQWGKLAPLLPPQRPRMGRPPKDHRLIVEAIVWLDRTGAPWRDLPAEYGPWETVASRFYRWRRRGVWERVLACL